MCDARFLCQDKIIKNQILIVRSYEFGLSNLVPTETQINTQTIYK